MNTECPTRPDRRSPTHSFPSDCRRAPPSCWPWLLAGLLACLPGAWGAAAEPVSAGREAISLNGAWEFQREGGAAWKTVQVPGPFEDHEGTAFDGVGIYRRTLPPLDLRPGQRVLLHFQASATWTEVWVNGVSLGSHLGGWTPFRFDATEAVRRAPRASELRVRVDEKVGHNSQGFLPIVAPHFGGLWQDVRLLVVPERYLDDLSLLAVGNPHTDCLDLELPMRGGGSGIDPVTLRFRLRGESAWNEVQLRRAPSEAAAPAAGAPIRSARTLSAPGFYEENDGKLVASVPVPGARRWSPREPNLYELEVAVPGGDRVSARAAFRQVEVFGTQLRLNGAPLNVRGVLNWGYYPPHLAPVTDEPRFRRDLEWARASGFNLMKFCLWVPPARSLDLADELGMLAWMECPTWHPQLTARYLEPLQREFTEFFLFDRNHPCVILRSLTCETGAGADLGVVRSLYDLAHRLVPGAVVEDDSSWIGWNRVHDFYDDHPYGNNHTWVPTLREFNEYVLAHGAKPLVLGEAIAADTWVGQSALRARLGQERPYWAPRGLDAQTQWLERLRAQVGPLTEQTLRADSLRYGMLMRKYQAEAFRREVPYGGYVISVIRDFPLASMGLIDYLDQPKWNAADWAWQGDTACLLATPHDARAFAAGGRLSGHLLVSHFAPTALGSATLTVRLAGASGVLGQVERTDWTQAPGTLAKGFDLDFELPQATQAVACKLEARLKTPAGEARNEWPLWIVPPAEPGPAGMRLHESVSAELAAELFPQCPRWTATNPPPLVVASRFDDALARYLEAGGRVLFLPDGGKGSFALSSHWFLRGAPVAPPHPVQKRVPHELWMELQHFDLASDVIPNLSYLEHIDPILLLWDTHDSDSVKTHGLVFDTRVGEGRLLVSALRHRGPANPAGRWLLGVLLEHLERGESPRRALPPELWAAMKRKLHEQKLDLTEKTWRFRPDPRAEGVTNGWQGADLDDTIGWSEIKVGQAWEGQGFPSLDGWAWYRLRVNVPESWRGQSVFLSFEGVDDCYELYVNGRWVARRGDPVKRLDTFSERFSHDLSAFVEPGRPCQIAVRVYDWYGSGGIFRPVTLGTTGFGPGSEVLK